MLRRPLASDVRRRGDEPSLEVEQLASVEAGDRFVVRSRATGTPRGTFMGVETANRRFEIMTIDMHRVRGGRVTETHHVEDWLGAIGQLRAEARRRQSPPAVRWTSQRPSIENPQRPPSSARQRWPAGQYASFEHFAEQNGGGPLGASYAPVPSTSR